jgi:hypothetical protein
LAQICHHGLSKVSSLRLHELVTIGQHHGRCGVTQPERTIPGYVQMSGYHGGVCFVKFGEEMKH